MRAATMTRATRASAAAAVVFGGTIALASIACGVDGDASSAASGGTASSSTGSSETNHERAARELCDTYCACYPSGCKGGSSAGTTDCIEEAQEPTGKGEACDDEEAKQMDCATAAISGCPAGLDFESTYINCAPPKDEQVQACGPGGIPG